MEESEKTASEVQKAVPTTPTHCYCRSTTMLIPWSAVAERERRNRRELHFSPPFFRTALDPTEDKTPACRNSRTPWATAPLPPPPLYQHKSIEISPSPYPPPHSRTSPTGSSLHLGIRLFTQLFSLSPAPQPPSPRLFSYREIRRQARLSLSVYKQETGMASPKWIEQASRQH